MKSIKVLFSVFVFSLCLSNIYAQVRGNATNANYARPQQAANVATYGNLNVNNNIQRTQPAVASFFNDYTTILRSRVLMNVQADSYTAVFHLTQVGETAADADKFMNERINGLKSALTTIGVKPEEIETDIICLFPIF